MLLELSKLRGPIERVVRRYEASALGGPDEAYRFVSSVLLEFDACKDGDRYRLSGSVKAALELECSRCAESFEIAVDTPFDLRYLPAAENAGEGEIEVQEDDLDASFYRGETIDLAQLVREQIYLALPMKPLCGEDCRGLCPECGTNWNFGACSCAPKWEDPRWAGLRSLAEDTARED
ncbi:MAG: DUF177 domain-containing protein [Vicinamibacterales bacterium]